MEWGGKRDSDMAGRLYTFESDKQQDSRVVFFKFILRATKYYDYFFKTGTEGLFVLLHAKSAVCRQSFMSFLFVAGF